MKHNNILRKAGEEFIEEAERADDLINRGFAILVEEIKEKAVKIETAVKEEKKETAKPKKETAKATKEEKKNAKK